MKKANPDHKRFEAYALPILKKIAKILLVEDYAPLTIRYGVQNKEASAECGNSYPYKSIHIKYSDDLVKDWKEGEDVIPTLVHEMCHPLTDALYVKGTIRFASRQEIEDERERLTDHIANIILKSKLV